MRFRKEEAHDKEYAESEVEAGYVLGEASSRLSSHLNPSFRCQVFHLSNNQTSVDGLERQGQQFLRRLFITRLEDQQVLFEPHETIFSGGRREHLDVANGRLERADVTAVSGEERGREFLRHDVFRLSFLGRVTVLRDGEGILDEARRTCGQLLHSFRLHRSDDWLSVRRCIFGGFRFRVGDALIFRLMRV